MKITNPNIENVPVDVIGMLMSLLLAGGFEDCFNLFLAWAQSQRPPVVLCLLNALPISEMYKYGNVGTAADKASFVRFFDIAERLGVYDAILYKRCHEILCGVGDINGHLSVIEGLVGRGHFLSMVASFSMRNIFKKESIARNIHSLSRIVEHREFKYGVVRAVVDLGSISASSGQATIGCEADFRVGCHIHAAKDQTSAGNDCACAGDCFFCNVGMLLNVFSRKAGNV